MSVRRTIRHPGTSASRRAIESEGIIFLRRDVASRYYSTRRRRRSASPPHHVSPSDGTPRLSPEPRSVRRASIRRAPSRRVFRRLEVHGVLGEEVLAFGRLGDHAEEGLEGEAGDGEEGGEQNHHRDAEGAGALGTRGRGKGEGRVRGEILREDEKYAEFCWLRAARASGGWWNSGSDWRGFGTGFARLMAYRDANAPRSSRRGPRGRP